MHSISLLEEEDIDMKKKGGRGAATLISPAVLK